MGKRFGRNQRRKLREQVATMARKSEWQSERSQRLETAINEVRRQIDEWNDRIAEVVGPDSRFLKSVRVQKVKFINRVRISYVPIDAMVFQDPKVTAASMVEFQRDFWHLITVACMDDITELRRHCNLIQELPDGQQIYCVTAPSIADIRRNGRDPEFVRFIAKDLARYWSSMP